MPAVRCIRLSSGPPCTDYAGNGHQLKDQGKQQIWHELWRAERRWRGRQRLEDCFVFENVLQFPAHELAAEMTSTHEVRWAFASPEDLGFPVRRPRLNFFGLNRETYVWTGPSQDEFQTVLR